MATTTTHPTNQKVTAAGKLWWVGPLTIITAATGNLIIRAIAVTFFGISDGFTYFQPYYVIGSTITYLLLAFLVFALVARFARQPVRVYRLLALAALCVSYLSPVMALAGLFPVAGMNLHIFWTMIAMHTVTAIITIWLLTTLAVTSSRRG